MKIYEDNLKGLQELALKQGLSVEHLVNLAIGHYLIDCKQELEKVEE